MKKTCLFLIFVFMLLLVGCNKEPNVVSSNADNSDQVDNSTTNPNSSTDNIYDKSNNDIVDNNLTPSTDKSENEKQSSEESKDEEQTSGNVWSDDEDWGPLHK